MWNSSDKYGKQGRIWSIEQPPSSYSRGAPVFCTECEGWCPQWVRTRIRREIDEGQHGFRQSCGRAARRSVHKAWVSPWRGARLARLLLGRPRRGGQLGCDGAGWPAAARQLPGQSAGSTGPCWTGLDLLVTHHNQPLISSYNQQQTNTIAFTDSRQCRAEHSDLRPAPRDTCHVHLNPSCKDSGDTRRVRDRRRGQHEAGAGEQPDVRARYCNCRVSRVTCDHPLALHGTFPATYITHPLSKKYRWCWTWKIGLQLVCVELELLCPCPVVPQKVPSEGS